MSHKSREKLLDLLSKYQKYFLGLAIFLSLSAVSITYSEGEIQLTFRNYPALILLLVAISIVFALLYIMVDKQRIKTLSDQITERSIDINDEFKELLLALTPEQRKVYDLIISGKSNKEIMSDLFIEQSTLKSHINQIYRKLNIKNRKELKSKDAKLMC